MKNFKLITKTAIILLAIVILQSCGNRTPIIDGEKPFVVVKIVKYDETHSKYYAVDYNSGEWKGGFETKPAIILPSRMYQINDTIKSLDLTDNVSKFGK